MLKGNEKHKKTNIRWIWNSPFKQHYHFNVTVIFSFTPLLSPLLSSLNTGLLYFPSLWLPYVCCLCCTRSPACTLLVTKYYVVNYTVSTHLSGSVTPYCHSHTHTQILLFHTCFVHSTILDEDLSCVTSCLLVLPFCLLVTYSNSQWSLTLIMLCLPLYTDCLNSETHSRVKTNTWPNFAKLLWYQLAMISH